MEVDTNTVRPRTPPIYDLCDRLTGWLLLGMVVFSPWAFGTTQSWSIATMNAAAYILGGFLAVKWLVRWRAGYTPYRWGHDDADPARLRTTKWLTRVMAGCTVVLLAYVLVQYFNARADYLEGFQRFEYFENVPWLPTTYDRTSTLEAFWQYFALAISFWAARDWLLAMSPRERRGRVEALRIGHPERPFTLPERLNRLLWVLCVNGALVALVAILQRLDGTAKILWIMESRWQKQAIQIFGPWPYRGNAAQYFNMVWPVAVGFLWTQWMRHRAHQRRNRRHTGGPYLVLLPLAALLLAAPFIAASRMGMAVAGLGFCAAIVVLYSHLPPWAQSIKRGLLIGVPVLLVAAGLLAKDYLVERLNEAESMHTLDEARTFSNFAAVWQIDFPTEPDKNYHGLFLLSDSPDRKKVANSVVAAIQHNGNLLVRLTGNIGANRLDRRIPGFKQTFAGEKIELALLKTTNLVVRANGIELEGKDFHSDDTMAWDQWIDARYIYGAGKNSKWHRGGPVKSFRFYEEVTSLEELETQSPMIADNYESLDYTAAFADSGRGVLYETAHRIAGDFPRFGIGAGAFGAVFQMYRSDLYETWAAYAHDDWLEFRATLGWAGFGIVLIGLAGLVFLHARGVGCSCLDPVMRWVVIIALAGCLLHAKLDFPFRIYSVFFLWVILAAVASVQTRPHADNPPASN